MNCILRGNFVRPQNSALLQRLLFSLSQELTTPEFLPAPESGDHVPKDDRDTGPHQPLPDRRALRHGASAPAHQRARLQDRHALLPAVRAGARRRQGVRRPPRQGLPSAFGITKFQMGLTKG